jgi:hypothetical protein
MILAHPQFFTRQHFEAQKGTAPAELCELVVHCLELVSQLAHRGLDFRFKGGNSLLVLLEDPQRFSIDVDIVTTVSKEELIELVQNVARECSAFERWEVRQPKTKPWLPMLSFKLFFKSQYRPEHEAYVMLDAVLKPPPYAGVRRAVRCAEIYESPLEVEVPSVSGLIGDKLLTLGPSTLGIPIGKGKEAQRLKHLFDVALLARTGYELDAVRDSVRGCLEQELEIQGKSMGWPEIRADTQRFCSAVLEHSKRPDPATLATGTYLFEIAVGFEAFRTHLFQIEYDWTMLRDDATRILALLDELDAL